MKGFGFFGWNMLHSIKDTWNVELRFDGADSKVGGNGGKN